MISRSKQYEIVPIKSPVMNDPLVEDIPGPLSLMGGSWVKPATSVERTVSFIRVSTVLPHAYPNCPPAMRLLITYQSRDRTYTTILQLSRPMAEKVVACLQDAIQVGRDFEATRVLELPTTEVPQR